MTIKVAINGYGRIGRNILRAHYEGGKKHDLAIVAINDLGSPETNAHLTRYDTVHGKFPGQGRRRRRRHGRQRRSHQGPRSAQPGRAAMGSARRRRRARVHGTVHDQGKGVGAYQGRCEEGDHLRARRQGCRCHRRLRREPPHAQGRAHRDLQCVVHDQLPGAAGQAAARQDRRRVRADDHDTCIHQRPGA